MAIQGGWEKAELEYWDPSVVVAAVNPSFVTKRFDDVRVCVATAKGDHHGTVFIHSADNECKEIDAQQGTASVYTAIDTEKFYRDFFGTLNRN